MKIVSAIIVGIVLLANVGINLPQAVSGNAEAVSVVLGWLCAFVWALVAYLNLDD